MADTTTIAALATAPFPAGIAVIRVSGPNARRALRAVFRSKHDPIKEPRKLTFGDLIDYKTNEVIDHALAVFMRRPLSYTGEDVVEFQFHGSPLVVQKILRSLYSFGVTPAEPGEFTKRAFLNGKIDLVQSEAIADLINATSDQALKIAGEQLEGRFSDAVNSLGEPLKNALAEIDAQIDFPEEEIEPAKVQTLAKTFKDTQDKLAALLATYSYGHVVKEGFRVLLCGRPNVGKSSILNRLLGRDRAIVTNISGTTRDLIEEEAILSRYRFVFCDSAGLTETKDEVERIGVELARSRLPWADLVIYVVDAQEKDDQWQKVLDEIKGKCKKIWMVTNKIDLNPNAIATFFCDSTVCAQNFYLSAKSGDGFEALTHSLVEEVEGDLKNHGETSTVITNERHRTCLIRAYDSLTKATQAINEKFPLEILSAEVRIALLSLEEIVGKTYTEDILGRIFSKFCIGK